MALVRWDPFREMDMLRRQMDRLFYDLAEANRDPGEISPETKATWMPAIETHDRGSELVLKAEIPGVEAKDLDIQVMRDRVLIAGEHRFEKRSEEQGQFRSEFRYGSFHRIIPLPVQVQNDQVKADLKDGVLTLTLPKVEEERNKVFKVSLSGSGSETAALEAGNSHTEAKETQSAMDS
jgi:HSP20 family protein